MVHSKARNSTSNEIRYHGGREVTAQLQLREGTLQAIEDLAQLGAERRVVSSKLRVAGNLLGEWPYNTVMMTPRFGLGLLLAVGGLSCASEGVDSQQPDVEERLAIAMDDCRMDQRAEVCAKAGIIGEYEALEADKAGDLETGTHYWSLARDSYDRACELGHEDACTYAAEIDKRLASR